MPIRLGLELIQIFILEFIFVFIFVQLLFTGLDDDVPEFALLPEELTNITLASIQSGYKFIT